MTLAMALGAGFRRVGVALATPGVGIISAPVHARGTIGERQVVNSKSGIHLKTKGSVDVATQQIVIAGGGSTGWHSHPGPVLVTVKSGSLRLIYADDTTCEGTVYEAGDSFIDRGDEVTHIARNESLDPPRSSCGPRTSCPSHEEPASRMPSHRRLPPLTDKARRRPRGRSQLRPRGTGAHDRPR